MMFRNVAVVALPKERVDLVKEHDGRRVLRNDGGKGGDALL